MISDATSPNLIPDWMWVKEFEADSPFIDKVARVFNNFLLFATALISIACTISNNVFLHFASYLTIALVVRKIISIAIGCLVCPAVLKRKNKLKLEGDRQIEKIKQEGFIAEKISLYKSGVKYAAVCIAHQNTVQNGKWRIHALGAGQAMEDYISGLSEINFNQFQCNTLLINAPSVGSSGGWPTCYQMGAGFEAGLTYLEKTIKATHIIMNGYSLGGGMMAEAILNHDFTAGIKNNIHYLCISRVTFGRLSTVPAAIAGRIVSYITFGRLSTDATTAIAGKIVQPIFYLVGVELDGVSAAKKLSQLGISQIIVQHCSQGGTGSDDTIPDKVSLAYELHKEPEITNKIFLESHKIGHSETPKAIKNELNGYISDFLSSGFPK